MEECKGEERCHIAIFIKIELDEGMNKYRKVGVYGPAMEKTRNSCFFNDSIVG